MLKGIILKDKPKKIMPIKYMIPNKVHAVIDHSLLKFPTLKFFKGTFMQYEKKTEMSM